MKKVVGIIGGVVFTLTLLVALASDPNPPPGHLHSSVDDSDIMNTYSDPNPPPGTIGL